MVTFQAEAWISRLKMARKIIRVSMSFNDESDSEWLEILTKVTSGQSRAAILRAHLMAPTEPLMRKFADLPVHNEPLRKNSSAISKKTSTPPVASTQVVESVNFAPKLTVAQKFSVNDASVNSTESSTGPTGTFLPNSLQRKLEPIPVKARATSNSEVAPETGVRRSGMAAMLLSKGLNGIGES